MYICICEAVTEGAVKEACTQGCRSVKDLQQELGVARECCACAKELHAMVKQAKPVANLDETSSKTV